MKKKTDSEWLFEKRVMSKKYIGIMGNRIPVRDVPDGTPLVAYTSSEPAIYISKDSKFTEGLDPHKARAFRFGIFAKEMMRQAFTDYNYQKKLMADLEDYEKPIFPIICSIIEEPAVENLAPAKIGGFMLAGLRYATKRVYDCSPEIGKGETPFEEFLRAMEQYGDMGVLKGTFKTPAARTVFYHCSSIVLRAIDEPDAKKRADMELEIHKLSKPLWEADAKAAHASKKELEEYMARLDELSGALGKAGRMASGTGSEEDPEDLKDMADYSKGALRKTTFKKLEDMTEEEKEAYEKSKEEKEEYGTDPEEKEERRAPVSDDDPTLVYSDSDEYDLSTVNDFDPETDEIDAEACDDFDYLVKTEIELENAEIAKEEAGEAEAPEFPEIAKSYSGREYSCGNHIINITNPAYARDAYEKITESYLKLNDGCYKKLRTLLAEDPETTTYSSRGKMSLKRVMSSTVTSKMFTKKVDPKDKSDIAVFIAVDESGSMSGTRIQRARAAVIELVEIFSKLNIPTYVMGFSADMGRDAEHYHYVMWSTKKSDFHKLTSMEARANNFDGYSIRYASNILDGRPEKHKFLIVISDGQPACSAYSSGVSGISDTSAAIREARKKDQIVLGVAIGAGITELHSMYGNDFIFITQLEDIFSGIVEKFSQIVKKW